MNFDNSDPGIMSVAVQGGSTALALAFLRDSLTSMIPFLIVAAFLIVADLGFGVAAALKRKEKVRFSRMIRRTVGKAFEYLCWVTVSASISQAFEMPRIQQFILAIVIGNELYSIFSNWAFIYNKKIRGFNWMKMIGDKFGVNLDEAKIEDIKEDKHDDPNNEKL